MQFFANSALYGPPLRNEWISLQQQHAALVAFCEFKKEPPENPVKSTPESIGVGVFKRHKLIYDALAHLRFLSQIKRVKALSINDHRRDAFCARSKDPFSTSILQGTSDKDIGLTNPEFHELTAAMFGLPSPICKQNLGAQINKANQIKTVDSYGDIVKPQQVSQEVPLCTSTRQWSMWSRTISETGKSCSKQVSTLLAEQSAEIWSQKNDRPMVFFQT
jgi:hypothetical protein